MSQGTSSINLVSIPKTAPTAEVPAIPAQSRGCCRIFTHWRSGVLFCVTAVAVFGFAKTFFPDLASKNFDTAAYAILAAVCLYYAKDTYDRELQILDLSTDLANTEVKLADTQEELRQTVNRLEDDERKFQTVADTLGLQTKEIDRQNTRLETSNTKLEGTVHKIEQIIDKRS